MTAMNELNRILHNKPVKFFYFVRNFARYAVPHALLQRRLDEVLSEIDRRDDREEILRRAAYYNRLPGGSVLLPSGAHALGAHPFGRGVRTSSFL